MEGQAAGGRAGDGASGIATCEVRKAATLSTDSLHRSTHPVHYKQPSCSAPPHARTRRDALSLREHAGVIAVADGESDSAAGIT